MFVVKSNHIQIDKDYGFINRGIYRVLEYDTIFNMVKTMTGIISTVVKLLLRCLPATMLSMHYVDVIISNKSVIVVTLMSFREFNLNIFLTFFVP